jgi:hypothetical protein
MVSEKDRQARLDYLYALDLDKGLTAEGSHYLNNQVCYKAGCYF